MQISTSFVQDSRHVSKSERFVPVQPSQISAVLADHGLVLNHLKSSKARLQENAHHQTTIARYVSTDSADMIRAIGNGSTLDLLVKAPHLTGCVELRLGFFRGVCANQWNAGSLVGRVKIRHTGDCLELLNRAIPALVAQRSALVAQIETMGARQLTAPELAGLAQAVADIRLDGIEHISRARIADLMRVRRPEDQRSDLFSAVNVLQENALRFGLRYETRQTVEGVRDPVVRHMATRRMIDTTATSVEMTGSIWEAAAKLLG
jgi:hypothetical protein